jgi:PAS domain S-box-containing protein
VFLAVLYQLITVYLGQNSRGFPSKASVEVLFHGVIIPLFSFWTLKRISRWLDEYLQIQKDVQSVEHRKASIINTAADAILSADAHSRVECWNTGAERLFGYAAGEITGRPFSVLLGEGAAAEVETRWLVETVQREGYVHKHETMCRDVLGRLIYVELTVTRLSGDRGESSGMSVILRDITSRKRREEVNRRLNTSLNQQAAERSRELAEKIEQIAQAHTELKQLDQTRSEFVSLVSHQIRSPLTNIAGAVQRMQADCRAINPTCTRMFTIFEQQVARLDRLVQEVLNTARIEAGELSLHLEPITVLPVVRQVIQQICARTASRAVHLADKPGLPLVYADRDRIAEILSNLLDNADKYSPPGDEVFIEVRADQSEVTIAVRDSGPGLLTKDVERVFDKFYRADSSDAQIAYGYGLGLYVCRRLVEAQNGRIWAESHPDGGAVFSFSLPVWPG